MAEAVLTNCDACNGTLTFNTTGSLPEIDLMNGFAWCAADLSDLWKLEVRGDDRIIPGLDGARAYPRAITTVTMQFPMRIVGAFDEAGNPNVDPVAGLAENLAYLRTNLEMPIATGDGTRPATWVREDGVTLLADVHVIPPLQHRIDVGNSCRAVLTISVARGLFTATGS